MKNLLIVFLILTISGCCKEDWEIAFDKLVFECNSQADQYLLSGYFDDKYFCYSEEDDYQFSFKQASTFISMSDTINIDSLNNSAVYYRLWKVLKPINNNEIHDHYISIHSPYTSNAEDLDSLVKSLLIEEKLNAEFINLDSFNVEFWYKINDTGNYQVLESRSGKQSLDNYIRIVNFKETRLMGGQSRYQFKFEFNCNLYLKYGGRHGNEYYGKITDAVMNVDFIL